MVLQCRLHLALSAGSFYQSGLVHLLQHNPNTPCPPWVEWYWCARDSPRLNRKPHLPTFGKMAISPTVSGIQGASPGSGRVTLVKQMLYSYRDKHLLGTASFINNTWCPELSDTTKRKEASQARQPRLCAHQVGPA